MTREALCLFTPGERDLLLVNFYNHVPNAARIATEAEVRWAGRSTIETALAELRCRSGEGTRIGVVGPFPHAAHVRLAELATKVVEMSGDYQRLRLVKSTEEIEWLRVGCELTDSAIEALWRGLRPGLSEHDLADMCERAYVGLGGSTHIHYFGVTPMAEPGMSVPAQFTSNREVRAGDVVSCEISASYWDYTGQVLRTFAVAATPTAQYRELHKVAEAAFDAITAQLRPGATTAELIAASAVIEEAGYTIRDDLIHGFVAGYLPPVLGSSSRRSPPCPTPLLRPG